ncbi:MAG: phosphodiesterase [Caulobacter sp.]|nr:phosphodiesterase [Caulobacter sp.]
MTFRRCAGALAGLALLAAAGFVHAAEPKPVPKLVVVVSVDQFSANLFSQYRSRFTGGLHVIAEQGLTYANGWQSHMGTETCPGHSTILTGKHPNKTGIPANDWVDPVTGKEVYCFTNTANVLADPLGGGNGPVGPDNMVATTLGDWLKAASPASRVFGVSGKDRGAIAMAGHHADGVYWWREGFGFTTFVEPGQTAVDRLAPVAALNAELKARFAAQPPGWAYAQEACRKLEGDYVIAGEAWHTTVPPRRFAFDTSPLLDEVTVEAALRLLADQKLGAGPATDLLAISLSGTDRIGHSFGTQGPEMCEQMYRLDTALGTLTRALESVPGGAVLVLTADHGGSDFPERLAQRGYPQARRVDFKIIERLNAGLKARFKLEVDPVAYDGSGLMIVGKGKVRLPQPLRGKIAKAAVEMLASEPDVEAAFLLDDLLKTPAPPAGTPPELFTLQQRAALSAVAGRSPDVAVILKWGVFPLRAKVGGAISTHGSAWDYDRRVPILMWWPGASGQERMLSVDTTDIAPTLAHLIGVTAPADIDGRCLDLGGFAVAACPAPAPAAAAPEPQKPGFRWPWEKN